MKKTVLALMLALTFGLAGCASDPLLTATGFMIEGAERLSVTSGETGAKVDIVDEEDIEYITDNIGALAYSKEGEVNGDGFSYSLQWYDADGNLIESMGLLGDGYTVIFDGHYYKGMEADCEIDLDFIEDRFTERLAA